MRLALIFAAPILEAVISLMMAVAAIAWTLRVIASPI
jgi:hypothetical protein